MERARGVVAVSSGNHAQGVAEAARLFGIAATIIMPSDAPAVKRRRTERSGARVIAYDRASDDREAIAADLIARHGGTLIHPYNNAAVIAGQGTIGLEVAADCDALGVRPSVVAVPCGGGGLSSGVNIAMSDAYPEVRIALVEPENFDDYRRSLREGRIVRNATSGGSVCDALMAQAPGAIGYSINSRGNASAVAVSDSEALGAVAFAFRELKLVVEPGGAVALAAALADRIDIRGNTAVIVLSGGNIDESVLSRALASDGAPD
jgi:threonine dehydratase